MYISNWIMWIISKCHPEIIYFGHIFAITSSSRHDKYCQTLQRLFCVLQYSRNSVSREAQTAITSQTEWRHEGIKYRAMLDVIKYV